MNPDSADYEVDEVTTAERAVLASCIASQRAFHDVRRIIVGADFLSPWHQEIFNAVSRLDYHGKGIDLMTVKSLLTPRSYNALADLTGLVALPDHAATYAEQVRAWSIRRRLEAEGRRTVQIAMDPETPASTLAATIAARFVGIRDSGTADDDMTMTTFMDLLAEDDDEPDWLVPGLLERRDRFILTGEEGLGKSNMLRQFALMAASGLHPFTNAMMEPVRTLVIDCENTRSQVRRRSRATVDWLLHRWGRGPATNAALECTQRLDITRDRDLGRIHQLLDAHNPDLVVIGPLYRLCPRALQTDDEAGPVLAALDTIRERGCALAIEAHATHGLGKGGVRDLRPRGSSALLAWPEFGYGMRGIGADGYADLEQWRGPREERDWPGRLCRAEGNRWVPYVDRYDYGADATA